MFLNIYSLEERQKVPEQVEDTVTLSEQQLLRLNSLIRQPQSLRVIWYCGFSFLIILLIIIVIIKGTPLFDSRIGVKV